MIVGITGHRIKDLGTRSVCDKVIKETRVLLENLKPTKVITGMAVGYDQLVAKLCLDMGIPFVAAVPFLGQELFWPIASQKEYKELLEQAETVEIVSRGGFANWKMHARNQWIVNNCSHLIAALRSSRASGGTFNCVAYAKSKNRIVSIIDPDKLESNNAHL